MTSDYKAAPKNEDDDAEELEVGQRIPSLWSCASVRLSIAIALALSLAIEGLMRSNINMAMVCMVNKTAVALLSGTPTTRANGNQTQTGMRGAHSTAVAETEAALLLLLPPECANMNDAQQKHRAKEATRATDDPGAGDLVFTKKQQSLIFTSFYLGGLLIILPGSYMCDWLGPSRLVLYGALVNVVGTFVTPFVARQIGAVALTVVRFLMGCGQGILVPCVNVLVAHWFPLAEKSTAIAISTTGNQISVVLAMFLTAELCAFHWLGGWTSSFYIYGFVGIVFCAIWAVLVCDYPAQSRRIQHDELRLIQCQGGHGQGDLKKLDPKEVPWRQILSSMVVWSTAFSSFSQNFMNVGIVVYLPSYYQNVLGMDLTSNGLMSALPFVVQLLTKIFFAGLADWAKTHRIMSPTGVTKLFNLIASIGAGLCFVLLSLCDCRTPYLAIALAVTAIGISSGFIPGYNTSVVCIAPRYTSSIASFSRLLGQIASVASPFGIGLLVRQGSKAEWQLAFWTMAAILFFTGILFQFFGSASVQEWANQQGDGSNSKAMSSEMRYHHLAKLDEAEEGRGT